LTKTDKISLLLIFIFSALNLFWLFSLPILPFIDLPFHLAESVVLKNFNNQDLLFCKFFTIPTLIKSNSLYVYFCSLNIFPNVEFGNKIFYSVYIFLFPVSVFTLIRTLKGNTLFSLLSFFFLINHNVHWGFVSYMISVPVIFFTFSSFYQYFNQNKLRYSYFIWILFIATFTLHFQMAIFSILIFITLAIVYQRRKLKQIIINAASIIPVLLIMIYAYLIDSSDNTTSLFSYMLDYYKSSYFGTLLERINVLFVVDNYFILRGVIGAVYSVLITIPIILFFVYLLFNSKIKSIIKNPKQTFVFILLIITFSCFLFLPDNIPGQNIIFERYTVLIFLLIITLISIFKTSEKVLKYFQYLIPLLVLVHSLIIIDYMLDFKKSTTDFNKELFPNSANSKLAGVILDNDFRGIKLYAHFPMYYTVWKNGITTGLIDYRFGLIKRNVSRDTLPQYIEWSEKQINYDEYYKPVDYLLVKSKEELIFNNFIPDKESGRWKLYKSNNSSK